MGSFLKAWGPPFVGMHSCLLRSGLPHLVTQLDKCGTVTLSWGSFLLGSCLYSKTRPKLGDGGVPPWGPSIRQPPKVCQRRAELISNWLCPITAGQSRHSFAQFDLKCSFPYPFLSPGAWGSPEPSVKKLLSASCWLILVDFLGLDSNAREAPGERKG